MMNKVQTTLPVEAVKMREMEMITQINGLISEDLLWKMGGLKSVFRRIWIFSFSHFLISSLLP